MSHSMFSSTLILFSCLFLLLTSTTTIFVSAHNITRILDRDPNFSTFNELLTKTHLAKEINRRKTITILAVPNDGIGDLAGKPTDVAKTILMNHVVLDYYDILKLQKMKGKSTILTTLYQTTGDAAYEQGFLNVTENKKTGAIVFGSAVKGAQRDVTYVDTVASQPYNISVLSVSAPIVAPGVAGQTLRPIAAPPKSHTLAPKLPPSPSEAPIEAPAPSPIEAPADAPEADAPAPSDAPADAPASSPSPDDASDKAESPTSSAVKHLTSNSIAFLVVLASLFIVN